MERQCSPTSASSSNQNSFKFFPFIYDDANYLCIYSICLSLGVLPGMNAPLLPDYVKKKSQGLANSYVTFRSSNHNSQIL